MDRPSDVEETGVVVLDGEVAVRVVVLDGDDVALEGNEVHRDRVHLEVAEDAEVVEEFLARQGSSRDEEDGESGRPGRDRGIVRGFARVRALVFARRGVHLVEHGLDNLRELVHEFEARPNEEHHLVARRLEGASLEVVEAIDAVLSQGGHLGDAHEGGAQSRVENERFAAAARG